METPFVLAQDQRAFNHRRGSRLALGLALCASFLGCERLETGQAPREQWSFPATGVRRVVVQSWRAPEIRTTHSAASGEITLSARPVLQATRTHGPEPDWRHPRADDWPFAWEAKRDGDTLVLRVRGETRFPHHRYLLEELELKVPPEVSVAPERQELSPAAPGGR